MDERTQFYLNEGWLTEIIARVCGAYEDGEDITEILSNVDNELAGLLVLESVARQIIGLNITRCDVYEVAGQHSQAALCKALVQIDAIRAAIDKATTPPAADATSGVGE